MGRLSIRNNSQLDDCCILLPLLNSSGVTEITGNDNSCSSIDAILEADCDLSSVESTVSEELIMYPNPTRDFLFSELFKNELEVSVLDISGRLVFQSRVDNGRLDMSNLSVGCYLVSIHSKDNNFNVVIVKQ